jgi:hypothetical protein
MNEAETSGHISAETVPDRMKAYRFKQALYYLVETAHDGGLHPSDMTRELEFWLAWAKSNSR